MTDKLISVKAKRPSREKPKPLAKMRRRLAEGGLDRHVQRPRIPHVAGKRVKQSPSTATAPTGPSDPDRRVEFTTYAPLGTPTHGGPIPPDPSGADSSAGVVLYTGNTYLMASTDSGATFGEHDTSTFLPAAQGRPVDQVMIYVPHRRLFAWMMQHGTTPGTGDGNFRLAVAGAADLASDVEAVVVATPIHTHHAVAREALLAGKHVLVEKPLAASVPWNDSSIRKTTRRPRLSNSAPIPTQLLVGP
jgi:hypothetical protein